MIKRLASLAAAMAALLALAGQASASASAGGQPRGHAYGHARWLPVPAAIMAELPVAPGTRCRMRLGATTVIKCSNGQRFTS